MSSVMRPSGPLPSRVYWVRRLMLLVVLLLLVSLVWWLAGRLFGGGDPAQAASPPPTQPSHSTEPVKQPPHHKAKQQHKHRPAQPTGDCDPAAVDLTVTSTNMAEGRSHDIKLELTSTRAAACTLAITPSTLALRITSGPDLIWSSDDCPDELLAKELVVRRHPQTTYTFTWDGHRSTDSCSAPGKVAKPGGYWAEAALIGADAHKGYFEIK